MKMKKFCAGLIGIILPIISFSQNLSVDEAMSAMKESSSKYLKGEFTKIDATGIDQYVDVIVTGVHSFSDYSFGNLMSEFVEYINTRPAGFGNNNLRAENIRKLDYAKENQTLIVAYSALVDYDGVTKFGETVKMSSLFFFNWKGEPIAARPASFDKDNYRRILASWMERKVINDLADMKDPLFNKEKWISETVYNTSNGNQYEMKYCFILDRGENETGTTGPFKAYYYQVQTSSIQIKSIVYISGRFTESEGKITFDYKKSSVALYNVSNEYTRTFQIDDFSLIDENKLEISLLGSTKATKIVRNSSSIPDVFELSNSGQLKMSIPFSSEAFTFDKD